jgi:hypothetical protein
MTVKLPASLAWLVALGLLVASGVIQGQLTGRWATSVDLTAAVARLDQLPRVIGTWKGEDADVDRATLQRIGISGGIVRRYRDAQTGSIVTVMLVCGRPGPVSVHTPDVCYEGAGYELAAPPSSPIPGFLAATMVRPGVAIPDRLQVYWSWNATGRWEVPENPRLAFGIRPYLYKLYVIGSSPSIGDKLSSGPAADLAKALTANFDPRPDRR